jgi:hypothetical protein
MIKSVVITPYLLESAKDSSTLTDNLHEFHLTHRDDSFKEVLFLVIDNNSDFIEQYKEIIRKINGKNLRLKSFIEDFVLKLKREKADVNNKEINIDLFFNHASDLKNLPKIDSQPYVCFPIKEEKLKSIIKNLTQFGKKITIFDPYISQHMTNYSKIGIEQINYLLKNININDIEKFKIKIQNSQNYKHSLREILKFILSGKIKDNLIINILTTIKKDDKKSFVKIIKKIEEQTIKSKSNVEKEKLIELLSLIKSELYDQENHSIVVKRIKSVISKCFSDLSGNKTKIEFDIINEFLEEQSINYKFYKKGFLIEGDEIKVIVDFGQGLNIYSRNTKIKKININGRFIKKEISKFELERNPEYQIRVVTNKIEKHKYSSITRFGKYEENTNKIAINS